MDLNLINKRAVVCGSSQGIGKAVAIELAKLGASITLVARNREALTEVSKQLSADRGQLHKILVVDFARLQEFKSVIQTYADEENDVHILINNTGGPAAGTAIEASTDAFFEAFSSHLICNQILTQAFVPKMKSAGYGRIINIISTSVKEPIHGLGVSNTIRAAVANWAKTLSVELGPYGITVNNVLPGSTETQRIRTLVTSRAEKTGKSESTIEEEMKSEIPLGRFADVKEIAAGAAFLATPAAGYINGINLPVDGGRLGSL